MTTFFPSQPQNTSPVETSEIAPEQPRQPVRTNSPPTCCVTAAAVIGFEPPLDTTIMTTISIPIATMPARRPPLIDYALHRDSTPERTVVHPADRRRGRARSVQFTVCARRGRDVPVRPGWTGEHVRASGRQCSRTAGHLRLPASLAESASTFGQDRVQPV